MNASQLRVSDALDALTAAVEDDELPNGVVWSLGYLRAWMEDRIVRDPYNESGAEDRYVRDAWKRISDDYGDGITFSPEDFMLVLRYLVPPDERIVAAADLELMVRFVECALNAWTFSGGDLKGAAARLREVMGDN